MRFSGIEDGRPRSATPRGTKSLPATSRPGGTGPVGVEPRSGASPSYNRRLPAEDSMHLEQIYLGCLSQASYLIVDEKTRTAAVVDPRRDVGVYLEKAAGLGATIRHVLLTHFHADFLAGHLELRERTGATIHLGKRGKAEYPVQPMEDGGTLAFGDVRLAFLETPGHTPES